MLQSFQPLRILMNADPLGGVWTYAIDLVKGLRAAGHEVLLAVMGGELSPHQLAELQSMGNLQWEVCTRKLEWMDEPWNEVEEAGRWLRKLSRGFRPDVIHLNDFSHGALPWEAPVVVVAHSCVFSWWGAVRHEFPPECYGQYAQRVANGLRCADVVVAPTLFLMEEIRRHYGFEGEGLLIRNGRDLPVLPGTPKSPFLFSAGRLWDEAKNMSLLDAVAPQLPWPVRLAGDTSHPCDGRVSFHNCQTLGILSSKEVRQVMEECPIYAAPVLYEPFGLSILEAAIAGCALVLADIPSLRELWHGAAVFIDPRLADQWAHRLQSLCDDPQEISRLGLAAQTRAEDYTATNMIASYLALYQKLLRRPVGATLTASVA